MPRSGSNLLHTLLNSHSAIICHGELFNRRAIYSALDRWHELSHARKLWALTYRAVTPVGFLERHLDATSKARKEASALGFKLFPYHSRRILQHVGKSQEYRVVYLTRKNPILQYASDRSARQTNKWLSVEQHTRLEMLDKVTFCENDFRHYVSRLCYYDKSVRTVLRKNILLEVAYESIDQSLLQIQEFLGVSPSNALRTKMRKQHSNDWRDRFTNPDELEIALSSTEWEAYL
ncbi:MAG TPA: sulfotransferase [Woeseiaceae bacterium]|nr:sulfotransferase [Woeseiaceae bacterium]